MHRDGDVLWACSAGFGPVLAELMDHASRRVHPLQFMLLSNG